MTASTTHADDAEETTEQHIAADVASDALASVDDLHAVAYEIERNPAPGDLDELRVELEAANEMIRETLSRIAFENSTAEFLDDLTEYRCRRCRANCIEPEGAESATLDLCTDCLRAVRGE